jgi:hypothetical protein
MDIENRRITGALLDDTVGEPTRRIVRSTRTSDPIRRNTIDWTRAGLGGDEMPVGRGLAAQQHLAAPLENGEAAGDNKQD